MYDKEQSIDQSMGFVVYDGGRLVVLLVASVVKKSALLFLKLKSKEL
jgi:hypothetical protein